MAPSRNRIAYYRDRCHPPLTQSALARALGRHVNTIQLWEKQGAPSAADLLRLAALFVERGAIADYDAALKFWEVGGRERVPFPIPPELQKLFTKVGMAEQRLLPDAPPQHAPLPPASHMPLHRNRLFRGRAEELQTLAASLEPPDATAVVSGPAGMGKTHPWLYLH